jgi:predicted dithiol-disulfide oxidoreductase (DUF899 family)
MARKTADRKNTVSKLLKDEIDLRDHAERVAGKRRALAPGPEVKEDYVFTEGPADLSKNAKKDFRKVKLSQLFRRCKKELLLYHFMYAPKDRKPCRMCSMWCDGYDAVEPYVRKRAEFVLVTKAPIEKLRTWARARGWKNIRLLSSYGTTFNRDLKVEDKKENQSPAISVFTKDRSGTVRHFYQKQAELDSRHNRGIDLLSPVWNLFDLLPSGRGDWYPNYEL